MLGLIEQFLLGRLQADPGLQRGTPPIVVAGPAQPPKTGSAGCLAIWARSLRTMTGVPSLPGSGAGNCPIGPGGEDTNRREAARIVRRLTLQPDRQQDPAGRIFVLPTDGFDDRTDQIAELTAAGRQLRAGDDYLLDNRTIRCLRDPLVSLDLRILGAAARGYVERCPADLELALLGWGPPDAAWEQQLGAADALLTQGVAVTLDAIAGREVLDLAVDSDAGFELRLLRPRGQLGSITRLMQHADAVSAPCGEAVIALRGEMELTLAHGLPEPDGGVIRQVVLDQMRS